MLYISGGLCLQVYPPMLCPSGAPGPCEEVRPGALAIRKMSPPSVTYATEATKWFSIATSLTLDNDSLNLTVTTSSMTSSTRVMKVVGDPIVIALGVGTFLVVVVVAVGVGIWW